MPLNPLDLARDAISSAQKHPAVAIAGGVAVLIGANLLARQNASGPPADTTTAADPNAGTAAGGVYGLGYSPGLGLTSGGSLDYGYANGLGGGLGGGASDPGTAPIPPIPSPPIPIPPPAPNPSPTTSPTSSRPPKPAGATRWLQAKYVKRLWRVSTGGKLAPQDSSTGFLFSAWAGPNVTKHVTTSSGTATFAAILSGSHRGQYVHVSDAGVAFSA